MTLEDRISMESMGRKPHATLWYTADELDWLARDYAARRGIDFDFKGAEVLVWIERDSEYLARVEYLQGLHEEMLSVWISRDGLAVKSQIAIAVDGSFIKALELKP